MKLLSAMIHALKGHSFALAASGKDLTRMKTARLPIDRVRLRCSATRVFSSPAKAASRIVPSRLFRHRLHGGKYSLAGSPSSH